MLKNKDIISIKDLGKKDIESVLELAQQFEQNGFRREQLEGKMMGSLFFEVSTRTRMSFEAAMQRLSGGVVGFADPAVTSFAGKGESFADTIRMVDGYADVIVIRHPKPGSAAEAAKIASHPVINAGDGANEHPTQTLVDLFAILKSQKKIDGVTIAMVGDLKYGRVPHSLARALTHWKVKQMWVSPESLAMPADVQKEVKKAGAAFEITESLDAAIAKADILYMTRVQAERFDNPAEYEKVKDVYVLSAKQLKKSKKNMRILHALPRRFEVPEEIDQSAHAYYFEQAKGGVAVRASLLSHVLGATSA